MVAVDGEEPPAGIESARITDAIDDPFSMYPPTHNGVRVHVRFRPEQAMYVVGRRWHRTQSVRTRRDGSVDVKFGPADLDEAAAWVRQWGWGSGDGGCAVARGGGGRRPGEGVAASGVS